MRDDHCSPQRPDSPSAKPSRLAQNVKFTAAIEQNSRQHYFRLPWKLPDLQLPYSIGESQCPGGRLSTRHLIRVAVRLRLDAEQRLTEFHGVGIVHQNFGDRTRNVGCNLIVDLHGLNQADNGVRLHG